MSKQSLAQGAVWKGKVAHFSGPEVGHANGPYALTDDGKQLKLKNGEPLRLVHVDLAPDDPDDGSEEYRIAGPQDGPQTTVDRLVELEPENVHAKGKADA